MQAAAFPEPDHQPELQAQRYYETLRDGLSSLAPPGLQREDVDSREWECVAGCEVPSHAEWFRGQYPMFPPAGECVKR